MLNKYIDYDFSIPPSARAEYQRAGGRALPIPVRKTPNVSEDVFLTFPFIRENIPNSTVFEAVKGLAGRKEKLCRVNTILMLRLVFRTEIPLTYFVEKGSKYEMFCRVFPGWRDKRNFSIWLIY